MSEERNNQEAAVEGLTSGFPAECCIAADGWPYHCPNHRPVDDALYAVQRDDGWHLAIWNPRRGDDGAWCVAASQMLSGDCWLPEWIDKYVYIAAVSGG